MRTWMSTLSALTLTLALAGAAAAQDRPAPDVSYDFADDNVLGDRNTPDGVRVDIRGRIMRQTLVRPRVHFVPELLKSVERL